MDNLRVSVVMATYNGSKFIPQQLDSIASQTKLPDELIIADDNSTDNTVSIIKNYISKYGFNKNWRVKINKKNKGYAKNFIEVALEAHGDIIFFCDQDDIWAKDKIEIMTKILSDNKDINLLCSNLMPFYFESNTRKWSKKDLNAMTNDGSLEKYSLNKESFHLMRSGCTMAFRKSFISEIKSYWIDGWAHDDFIWKMAVASNSCAIIQYCSLKRRMHSNNASVVRIRTRETRTKQLNQFLKQYSALLSYSEKKDLTLSEVDVIRKNIKSVNLRKNLIENRNILLWPLLLMKYRNCYPRIKGLYLDLYIAIFNKYEGAN